MANPEHVKELLKGVEHWNEWLYRQFQKDPEFQADLSGFDIWSPEAQESALFVATKKRLHPWENKRDFPFFSLIPDLRGAWLTNVDLSEANLQGAELLKANLQGAELLEANLQGADLDWANLQGANLSEANLQGVKLNSTNLQEAELRDANLQGTHLAGANLQKAYLLMANLQNAELIRANLQGANLLGANLQGGYLSGTNLQGAELREANLLGAELEGANLQGADLRFADLRSCNLAEARINRWGRFKGIRLDDACGSQRFIRFANDQYFIEEFRDKDIDMRPWKWPWKLLLQHNTWQFWEWTWNPFKWNWRFYFIYLPWLIFADCGRSLAVWAGWSMALAYFFGLAYSGNLVQSWMPHGLQSLLLDITPSMKAASANAPMIFTSDFSPYYFSIVTFTTLGFGDITPFDKIGEIWVTIEVILGYIMLGGLISIFANKLARRSG